MWWLGTIITKNGLFSIRSAYHVQWSHKFGNNHRTSFPSGTGNDQVWKALWNLDVPAKIKIFGWRVLHGIVPCRAILANRHIGNSGRCPVCEVGCEDIKHMLAHRTCFKATQGMVQATGGEIDDQR